MALNARDHGSEASPYSAIRRRPEGARERIDQGPRDDADPSRARQREARGWPGDRKAQAKGIQYAHGIHASRYRENRHNHRQPRFPIRCGRSSVLVGELVGLASRNWAPHLDVGQKLYDAPSSDQRLDALPKGYSRSEADRRNAALPFLVGMYRSRIPARLRAFWDGLGLAVRGFACSAHARKTNAQAHDPHCTAKRMS